MGEIDQFDHVYNAPLTIGARVIRGFRRAGAVVALPVLVLGLAASFYGGYNNYDYKAKKEAQASCLMDKTFKNEKLPVSRYDSSKIDPEAAGCKGPLYDVYPWEFPAYATDRTSLSNDFAPIGLGGGLASIVGAAILYGFFWAMGWIIAGFTRD